MRLRPITPDAIAQAWRLEPAGVAWPGRKPGMSAAVFAYKGQGALVLPIPSDLHTHILSVELAPCRLLLEKDGRVSQDGLVAAGAADIIRAGEVARARTTGPWCVLQFYVPAGDVRAAAEHLGVPSAAAQALEIVDPRFRRDALFVRLARKVNARLTRGEAFTRMELDELAIDVCERLVRRHSNVTILRRRPVHAMSLREAQALLALLMEQSDLGLDDASVLMDRPATEIMALLRKALTDPDFVRALRDRPTSVH